MNVLPHPSTGHLNCASLRRRLALAAWVALVVTCCFSTGIMRGSVNVPPEPYVPPLGDDPNIIWDASYNNAAFGARSASPFGPFRVSRRELEDKAEGALRVVLEPEEWLLEGADGRVSQVLVCSLYWDCCS